MGQCKTPRCPVCRTRSEVIDPTSFISRKNLNSVFFRAFFVLSRCERCAISFSTSRLSSLIERLCEKGSKQLVSPTGTPSAGLKSSASSDEQDDYLRIAVLEESLARKVQQSSTSESETPAEPTQSLGEAGKDSDYNFSLQLGSWNMQLNVKTPSIAKNLIPMLSLRSSRGLPVPTRTTTRWRPLDGELKQTRPADDRQQS
ncbi:MAG: hypothetical protein KDD70_00340 [Bdellovibrionales bacterium]|nr:hypothetical protein [Bdellovibrionales bacterium]